MGGRQVAHSACRLQCASPKHGAQHIRAVEIARPSYARGVSPPISLVKAKRGKGTSSLPRQISRATPELTGPGWQNPMSFGAHSLKKPP